MSFSFFWRFAPPSPARGEGFFRNQRGADVNQTLLKEINQSFSKKINSTLSKKAHSTLSKKVHQSS
jgi:hypothetical protein